MREYPEYRIVIEDLRQQYGNVDMIRIADFAEKNGIDARTVRDMFNLPGRAHYVGLVPLAHKMCQQIRGRC